MSWRSGGIASPFLTWALDGDRWSGSRPGRFTPGWSRPRYALDRRLGQSHSRPGRYGEQKNVAPSGDRTPAVQSVSIPTELSRLLMYNTSSHSSRIHSLIVALILQEKWTILNGVRTEHECYPFPFRTHVVSLWIRHCLKPPKFRNCVTVWCLHVAVMWVVVS
jgi:hypothetical protein